MTTAYSTLLGLALPVQGELSGTWGDTVDNGITRYLDIAVAGTVTLTNDGAVTLSLTNGDSTATNIVSSLTGAGTTSAQFAIIRVTGTLTVAKVLTAPSSSRTYVVVNAATGSTVTVKASGQTGVSIAVGETAFVYFNGTDYVKVSGTASVTSFSAGTTGLTPSTATTGAVTLAGTLATTNGGTGLTSFTANGVVYASSTSALATGSVLTYTAGLFTVNNSTAKSTIAIGDTAVGTYSQVLMYGGGSNYNWSLGAQFNVANSFEITPSTAGGGTTFTTPVYQVNNSGVHIWNSGGSEQMRLNSTGLGIGTSSPAVKLDVNGSINISSTGNLTWGGAYGAGIPTIAVPSAGSLGFYPNGSTSGLSMVLSSAGNLGIGTSSPSTKLDVRGTIQSVASGAGLSAVSSSTFYYMNVSSTGLDTYTSANASAPMLFSTGGSERARIDSAGNLGLGVTPSAWSAGKAIQINDTAVSLWGVSGNTVLSNNFYYASGDKYATTSGASQYTQFNGKHVWNTAPSGTLNTAITFTQAMTLDASGNLGVGTTTSRVRLEVAGNIEIANTAVDGVADALIGGLQATPRTSVANATFASANIQFRNDPTLYYKGVITFGTSGDFSSAAPTERARITSGGNLLVGATALPSASVEGICFTGTSSGNFSSSGSSTSAYNHFLFYNGNGIVGSISTSGSLTTYAVSSDYRLKTVIGPVADAGQRIDALQPVEYTWNSNGERTRGFLAHQFQEVYSGSVIGTKDAVDAEGKPVYQAMQASTSEVIADLVAEIQSLRKRLAAAGIA
tara:strand:- start:4317 stop:6680 length:2364 start_codon:yes stop_codon:yes gene_type:complete